METSRVSILSFFFSFALITLHTSSDGFLTGDCALGVLPILHSSPLLPVDRASSPSRSPESSLLSVHEHPMSLSSAVCPLENVSFRNWSVHTEVGVIHRVVGESSGVPRSRSGPSIHEGALRRTNSQQQIKFFPHEKLIQHKWDQA